MRPATPFPSPSLGPSIRVMITDELTLEQTVLQVRSRLATLPVGSTEYTETKARLGHLLEALARVRGQSPGTT